MRSYICLDETIATMPGDEKQRPHLTLEQVTQMAQKVILEQGGHHPTLIVEGHNQSLILQIQPIAPTAEGRAQQLFRIGYMLGQTGEIGVLQQAFFISEAWVSLLEGVQ